MKFILEASDETLSTHSGLGLIGLLLSKTELSTRLTSLNVPEMKSAPAIRNGDVITSYIWILSQSEKVLTILNHSEKIPSSIVH
ncbi:hypothetical protein [Evansella halocellulosilytica]|uniref:hypothetical protein n=1 Tax=Evansella halocellulosilytica TaxID=2011013 RepID=UPI000BB88A8A|nr:hypothetical protein [Evansella halocellulosilytica]